MRSSTTLVGHFFAFVLLILATIATEPAQGQGILRKLQRKPAVEPIQSQNFLVYAEDPILARKVSSEAERYRKQLAIEWLGHELPAWQHKCPIQVKLLHDAGGETSFAFVVDETGRGTPVDWQMKIFGPPDRVVDAVLPHEITHTIFATHFGQPLPRWADEGACTSVEHISERQKNHRMLLNFLTSRPSYGIPFDRMFTMRNYPRDQRSVLALYAQGYSVAKFLILQKGKRHFVDYIAAGIQYENRTDHLRAWDYATREFYNFKDLYSLQVAWENWVQNGSSETAFDSPKTNTPPVLVANNPRPKNNQNLSPPLSNTSPGTFTSSNQGSWYARQSKIRPETRLAVIRPDNPTVQTKKISVSQPQFEKSSATTGPTNTIEKK